jgi:hypothetical protein
MSQTETKPMTNQCTQATPDEAGRCGAHKISEDGKRHHCDKVAEHPDDRHACACGMKWQHMM